MNIVAQIDGNVGASDEKPGRDGNPIIIAGGGPAGTRAAQQLSKAGFEVILFNAERWRPYNRVKLTPLLAGEAQVGQIYTADKFPPPGTVARYDGVSVVDVDREEQKVLLSNGRVQSFSKLILALGSRAFVPGIPGADMSGVFVFRDFNDAEALLARSVSARKVVVVGGGLLGLEAARGMMKHGGAVTIVEHENRLMPRQLDLNAAEVLKQRIEAIGIDVLTGTRVQEIQGNTRVDGVALGDGEVLKADTVIICTGVRANTQLPAGIGLSHNRGVLVDDAMRTTDENIYAIGECAEHNEQVYGLVGPGYEQADVAAAHIAGDEGAVYQGSVSATKLKVLGADVFSMGDFESVEQQPFVKSYVFEDTENAIYRRVFVDRGKLVAALGVGEWPDAAAMQQAVGAKQAVYFLSHSVPLAMKRLVFQK